MDRACCTGQWFITVGKASIKNLIQPRLLSPLWVTSPVTVVRVFKIRLLALACHWHRSGCCGWRNGHSRAVQQFVKFTPVKPDTTAAGAVVNFDTLAVSHD